MTIPSKKELAELDANAARMAAIEYSQLFAASTEIIRKLEGKVKELSTKLGEQNQEVLFSKAVLSNMRKKMFGRSSERIIGEGSLFEGLGQRDEEETTQIKKKRTKFGYKEQPALPVVEIIDELSPEEITEKGLRKWEGQFEESDLITIVPTRFIIERHKRQKYFSGDEDKTIVTAPGPLKLKEGNRYSLEFGVEVGLSKYLYHLPLDRQVRMMKDYGLNVESQTLYSQTDTIAWYLKSTVMDRIVSKIHSERVKLADETSWGNLGKAAKSKFYLWGLRNSKAVCFNILGSRSGKSGRTFLEGLSGVLVTDGYEVYNGISREQNLLHAFCWYHVRRKFVNAYENGFPEEAGYFLKYIRMLSTIEDELKGEPPDRVLHTRQTMSKPIVEAIHEKLCKYKKTIPTLPLGAAVNYTLKLWSGLTVFLDNPDVPISTNEMERTFRGTVVGRNNHFGSKNLKSAEIAAIWYSVIETCKANNIDPRIYITTALRDILQKKQPLMPWEMVKTENGNTDQ